MNKNALASAVVALVCLGASTAGTAASTGLVSWTQIINSTSSGAGSLAKSAGCNLCPDAGAISSVPLVGDGYAEFVPAYGHRLMAGLSADLTSSTSINAIDFAFNFWPDGLWEVREMGTYRTDGPFAAGDRFRVVVSGGVVKYLKNGALVYTSAVTPAASLALDVTILTTGGSLAEASLTTGPVAVSDSAPAPTTTTTTDTATPGTIDTSGYFSAVTDRTTRLKPPLPAFGAAGTEIIDPSFQSRITRLTDGLTRPGRLQRSYHTPSSAHQHSWSAAGSYLYVVSTDGTAIPFRFDAATGAVSRINPTTTGDGGFVLRSYIEPHFSYVSDNLVYLSDSSASLRTIDQYDFQAGAYSRLIDLDTVVANLGGTYIGWIGSSAGTVERVATFFGGASQDQHYYGLVFDKNDPAQRRLVNTRASTVNGRQTNIPLNFSLHAMGIDRSGRYAMLYSTWADINGTRKAAPTYLWDLATDLFTELPLASALSGGHDAYGYGVRINQSCCTTTTWDAAQWQFRYLGTPFDTRDVISNVMMPKEVFLADHQSWHNARPDMQVPYVSALYRDGSTTEWRAWDDEVVGVQTDPQPGTPAMVWRFAHHRSNLKNDTDPTRSSFWYMPRPSVSDDGRWVMFSSNWEKSLGLDAGGSPDTAYRQDVFLIRLQVNVPAPVLPPPTTTPDPTTTEPPPPAPPVAIATTALPNGLRKKPYSATLSAIDGVGALAWSIGAGSLPPGLNLNATTGVIAGTPPRIGSWTFTVMVKDTNGSATRALTIAVK